MKRILIKLNCFRLQTARKSCVKKAKGKKGGSIKQKTFEFPQYTVLDQNLH